MRAKGLSTAGLGIALSFVLLASAAGAQTAAPTRDDIVGKLNHFEEAAEVDLPALKQQVMERAKARIKNDPGPVNRPLIAPDLAKLPAFNAQIQFDADTPIIQPASYQTVGRIADALVHSSLLPYTFLIVGHVESNSKTREANAILSQRRADAIRDVLVNTFKISTKRLHPIGLGEEQFLDRAKPTSAVNGQLQILTYAKLPEEPAHPAAAPAPAAKKPAKKR
ncbi:OmpA family protein [Bradyrhizobium sp. 180]|uniref:OmpA family protein n=1 Tax=unclassified Bradyrhizobium TaxID=2631580 RepID=UPI001FF9B51F|nr:MULTISPECIES: OmpA family protein [unclassified Bradyrhizobium]MCK1422093.1 OmpA family protein [Bradyrhizobium sp. CW12]MCK1492719.1 OmpA family protein [Bradyrhizobium sp. 180]MCK1528844.1 OmpA family protein [Bradyrhizobium sp. 182]MCK1598074.1 OmpA family protein [Bradyrhizobium sp. 164]MCK1620097.1 OmpA family protein [Bradyrhizobium sp. 159]